MIEGSMTHAEYRAGILVEIARAYREIKKLEQELKLKRFTKVFKDKNCKGAKKQLEWRLELEECLAESLCELMRHWKLLPEVSKTDEAAARAFAAKLCLRPRSRRYMKNQGRLIGEE